MKWVLWGILGVYACAQQPMVRVRLWWRNPPQQVRIEPIKAATVRACARCAPHPLSSAFSVEGSPQWLAGEYRMVVKGREPLTWVGEAQVARGAGGVDVTLSMPREQYVAAVLAGEASKDAPAEFLKAIAIAVRTYAQHESEEGRHMGFDFCDSTHCQDFKLQKLTAKFTAAADATHGEILWSHGRPAATYYHQDCGGRTADVREIWPSEEAAEYLNAHEDVYCVRANGVRWQSEITKAELARALRQFPKVNARSAYAVASRTGSGRVGLLRIGSEKMSATTFRFTVNRALGWDSVRSDAYDLRDAGDRIVLSGRGSGHGVGLCQNGAVEMAREGKSYREILAYYYPGTKVGLAAQGIAWQRVGSGGDVLWTTNTSGDGSVLATALRIQQEVYRATGLAVHAPLVLRIFPSVAMFRDATGEPGWIAGYVRGNEIVLQPVAVLRAKGALESTLKHELLHRAVEANSTAGTPRWFREGLVDYLAAPATAAGQTRAVSDAALTNRQDERATRAAYAAAQGSVAALVTRYGRRRVLGWLRRGLPDGIVAH